MRKNSVASSCRVIATSAVAALLALVHAPAGLHAANLSDFPVVIDIDFNATAPVDLPGRLHRPPNDMSGSPKPLILYLHGVGDVGSENEKQVRNADINRLLARTGNTAYIYAPQTASSWSAGVLSNVHVGLAKIMTEYNVAWDQVYITGLSLGGAGTWSAMLLYPIHAAGVPVCGADPIGSLDYGNLIGIPIWAFHVNGDTVVPVSRTRNRVNNIRAAAGLPAITWPVPDTGPYPASDGTRYYRDPALPNLRYSEYPHPSSANTYHPPGTGTSTDAHSFAWERAYDDSEPGNVNMMYDWMYASRKTSAWLQPDESVFVDFGHNTCLAGSDSQGRGVDSGGRVWNCANTGPEKQTNMPIRPAFAQTTDGHQTLVVVKVTDAFGGPYTGGAAVGTLYDENVAKDGWVTEINGSATLTLRGLTPGASYRLALFARATDNDSGFGRGVRYQIGGVTQDLTSAQVVNNVNAQAVFSSVQADASGAIALQVSPLGGARRGLLNALEITRLGSGGPAFFAQDFSSSTNYLDYVSATLAPDLFSDISAEVDAQPWSIDGGKLEQVRTTSATTSNAAGFTRLSVPVASAPDVMELSFEVSLSGVSGNQEVAVLDLGTMSTLQDYSGSTPSVAVANRLAFRAAGTGQYKLMLHTTSTPTYPADGSALAVSWMLNQSGATRTYRGQDGLPHSVDSGASDLWINGAKVLANIARNSNWTATRFGGFRFRTAAIIPITFQLDDFRLYSSLPQ